jgi:hypothetical protein
MAHQGRKLILVRHSLPEMITGVPASRWHLSAEGRRRCEKLAERLTGTDLAAIVSSEESKAAAGNRQTRMDPWAQTHSSHGPGACLKGRNKV